MPQRRHQDSCVCTRNKGRVCRRWKSSWNSKKTRRNRYKRMLWSIADSWNCGKRNGKASKTANLRYLSCSSIKKSLQNRKKRSKSWSSSWSGWNNAQKNCAGRRRTIVLRQKKKRRRHAVMSSWNSVFWMPRQDFWHAG